MQTTTIKSSRRLAYALAFVAGTGLTAIAAPEASAEVRARFARNGVLTIVGTREDDRIRVARTFGGVIHVNAGATPILGGQPDIVNTKRIVVRASSGDDLVELDETNGTLPPAVLVGGPGDDELRGGSGDDDLRGGPGDDELVGGRGNDRIRGDAGADTIGWFEGHGEDRVDGGAGRDQVEIRAPKQKDNELSLDREGRKLVATFDGPSPVRIEHLRVERVLVSGGDRRDVIIAGADLGKGVTVSLYGGNGDDVIVGSDGPDLIVGNGGRDVLDGRGGNDTIYGEGEDDTLVGGEGDDALDGGPGIDSIDGGPGIDVAANGEFVINVP